MAPKSKATSGVLWQVIAPWVRWPLKSPARLATVLGGVLAVLLLASTLHTSDTATAVPDPADAAATVSTETADPGSTPAPSTSPGTSTASTAAPATSVNQASASDTALGFVRLWARPQLAQPQWSADLAHFQAGAPESRGGCR